ncbi:hypothetical protein [Streptomyces sp. NPDC053560]|uniref:hypothetical protein n=1 Tax=Streptomyces sp. NPDC053560 TaxID=3365711 RepID=UPI0037D300A4
MLEVTVCANDRDRYPAWVDPDETHEEGWVKPYFTLETAQRIAEQTQADVAEHGHGAHDSVHVFDGGTENGQPRAVVTVICWMNIAKHGTAAATDIVLPRRLVDEHPDADPGDPGTPVWPIGGFDWCWYAIGPDGIHPQIPFQPGT